MKRLAGLARMRLWPGKTEDGDMGRILFVQLDELGSSGAVRNRSHTLFGLPMSMLMWGFIC